MGANRNSNCWGIIWYLRLIASTRIYTCNYGLVYADGSEASAFPWDKIVKIRQYVSSSHLPARGVIGRVPVGQLSTYRLTRDDGEEMGFNRETVSTARALAEHIAKEAEARGIEWEIVQDD